MEPLRGLAEGWGYRIDDQGRLCVLDVSREVACMYYQQAPAECFADAPAEEPLVEERTLRSPDGSFVMKVWRKDNPLRIEARIEQQPEEWRGHCGRRVDITRAGPLLVRSEACPALYSNALYLRGSDKASDARVFFIHSPKGETRDAYLAKLEATVAAMPRLADQFKEDDRVVVAASVLPEGHSAEDRAGIVGQHGRIMTHEIVDSAAGVRLDDGRETSIWLINLRRERDDEGPAGVTISGDEAVAAMNPDPRRANFPPTRYGANGLPIFEPKPEPPPVHMTVALVDGRIQVDLDPAEEK